MKFSIVTPSFNNAEYIRESLESVRAQETDFSVEHIVVDGGSTDGTLDILKEFANDSKSRTSKYSFKYVSEKDNGMYDAISKGFSMSTGEVMAWINTDDYYLPGAFQAVYEILSRYQDINWLKGVTDTIQLDKTYKPGRVKGYKRSLIRKGLYGPEGWGYFIQQDSVFWTRDLWKKIDLNEFRKYKYAGDFRLWQMFSEFSELVTFDKHVSIFRKRPDQKSSQFDKYVDEMMRTVKASIIDRILTRPLLRLENILKLNIMNPRRLSFNKQKWNWKYTCL